MVEKSIAYFVLLDKNKMLMVWNEKKFCDW